MARRRLTAIAGALGLLGWLATSGVAAQAATSPGPDLTYSSLLATYLWSSQDACVGGTSSTDVVTGTRTCLIDETQTTRKNIAVCVQSNTPGTTQVCNIRQTNTSGNNYALVIQRFVQNQGSSQDANQKASIQQTNGSGSNFAGVFQTVFQSIGQQDDPSQTNSQHVAAIAPNGPGGLEQSSTTGSNFAFVSQFSTQSASGGSPQTQTADQLAGNSGSGLKNGIDQTGGANAAFLSHIQKQQLDTGVSNASQTQNAIQDGDITQKGAPGQNLAVGSQRQDQQEQGPTGLFGFGGTMQQQTGDPKCCSTQNGGQFFINQSTNQFANNAANRSQAEHIFGNCDSSPAGCHVVQSATLNGTTTPGLICNGQPSCHQGITCFSGEGGCFTTGGGGSAPVALRSARPAAARSARPIVALLT